MPAVIVVGTQFGDEGKGKIVDFLAKRADMVVRYGGGNNAGHTVVVGTDEHKLHLIPSGILHKGMECVLGNGVVIDLLKMIKEMDQLEERGISTKNLYISDRAHIILPTHIMRDKKSEDKREDKIGTTGRGIGPTYTDKVGRIGIRVGDLALPEDEIRQLILANWKAAGLEDLQPAGAYQLANDLKDIVWPRLKDNIVNTASHINQAIMRGSRVLFEGAQGLLIDVDHGTYPYVTSSNPSAGGVCTGAGVGPTRIKHAVGVVKAYTTRVGEGPFPTELHDEVADAIRQKGNEWGTTTGRPRRCGWLDLVALKYAVQVNGLDSVALTKLDILDDLDEIKICRAYEIDGVTHTEFPSSCTMLDKAVPIYDKFPGWKSNTSKIDRWPDLPVQARNYVGHISQELRTPIFMIGVGAERTQIIGGERFWEIIK